MGSFERWLAWSGSSDEEETATLWLGMGLVAAWLYRRRRLTDGPRLIQGALQAILSGSETSGRRLKWRPPVSYLGQEYLGVTSRRWLSIIRAVLSSRAPPAIGSQWQSPLRVHLLRAYSSLDDLRKYHDLLLKAPWALSLSMGLQTDVRPYFRWPIRFGYLQGQEPDALSQARTHWTTGTLADIYALDRSRSNCDLLWFEGTVRELVHALTCRNYSCKANIVVLKSGHDGEWNDDTRALAAKLLQAGAIVSLRKTEPSDQQGTRLNNFLKNFSHDDPVDVALAAGFQNVAYIWAADATAAFRLTDVVGTLNSSLKALPDAATLRYTDLEGMFINAAGGLDDSAGNRLSVRGIQLDVGNLVFDQESNGATRLAKASRAITAAAAEARPERVASDRHLQMYAYVGGVHHNEAVHGFPLGTETTLEIRIGLPDDKRWIAAKSAPKEFAQGHEYASLTVWLTEPNQLKAPMRCTITLPATGNSTTCEFRFQPIGSGLFDGRVSVVHRGRVLQTARLLASVPETHALGTIEGAPRFEELHAVRRSMAELDERRAFDLSIVTNHTAADEPRMVALAAHRAWIVNTQSIKEPIKTINILLTEVAERAKSYLNGLDGADGREFLVRLARQGAELHRALVGEQLSHSSNQLEVANEEYIQVVSTRSEGVIPFEFIYTFNLPHLNATLCPKWRSSVETGKCEGTCELHTNPKHQMHVCPMGFWGQQKVIERHIFSPQHTTEDKDLFLQSERERTTEELKLYGSVVIASSKNVHEDGRKMVVDALAPFPFVQATPVKDWAGWKAAVTADKPSLILTMPHADEELGEVSLEIGGEPKATMDIDTDYVRPDGSPVKPIVVLLGCDTAEATEDYSRHVQWIRARGAAVVVATISTVAGLQAPTAAALLAASILRRQGATFYLGEAIRDMRREGLLANHLIPLALVAYGDADWKLKVGA